MYAINGHEIGPRMEIRPSFEIDSTNYYAGKK